LIECAFREDKVRHAQVYTPRASLPTPPPGPPFNDDGKLERSMQNELKTSNASAETDRRFPVRFENQVEEQVVGHRDLLIGLWAGAQLGLPEESCAMYALEVMAVGLMDPRPDYVVDKLMHDFSTNGIPITRGRILVQLSKIHRRMDTQYAATE
jgi:hypothetical protein